MINIILISILTSPYLQQWHLCFFVSKFKSNEIYLEEYKLNLLIFQFIYILNNFIINLKYRIIYSSINPLKKKNPNSIQLKFIVLTTN